MTEGDLPPAAAGAGGPAAGIFAPDDIDDLVDFFSDQGYATLRGAIGHDQLQRAEDELVEAQHQLAEGRLATRHGTAVLDDPDAAVDGRPFAHYICFATQASPGAEALARLPAVVEIAQRILGPTAWLLDYEQFGVVYQDARPGPRSGYSRIGWHTDRQSGPHLAIWPGMAFTIHFDPTSPANGFLRALPRSHHSGTDGIPLGFERVPGEIGLYQSAAMSCSTTPTSGTPPPEPPPMTGPPSVGTCGAVGTGGPGWRWATAPTTS